MIYLIRHGQTEFNREQRYQGAADSPLTALGRAQARAVGLRLAELVAPATPIVASPLGRAAATAQIIRETAGLTGAVAFDARIAEISMGRWDGLTRPEVEAQGPGFSFDPYPPPDWFMRSPDGETYMAFAGRLGDWLAAHGNAPDDLVVVSHGVASKVLRGLYLGLGQDEALIQPTPQDAFFVLAGGRIERIACELDPPALQSEAVTQSVPPR
jgi:probable phosphoglycerate mutase